MKRFGIFRHRQVCLGAVIVALAGCGSETEIEKTQRLLTGTWDCTGTSRGLSGDIVAEFTDEGRDKNFLGGANITLTISASGMVGDDKVDAKIVSSGEWRLQKGQLAEAYDKVEMQSVSVAGKDMAVAGMAKAHKDRFEQAFSNGSVFSEMRALDSTSMELVDPTGSSSPPVDGSGETNPEGRQLSCVKR